MTTNILEQEIINVLGPEEHRLKVISIPGFRMQIRLGIYTDKGKVYVLENGIDMEFNNQDIEIQEAITKEIRNKNYAEY